MKYVWKSLNVLSDAILITLAVLSVPCAVLTAYEIPFTLTPLVWSAILIGVCLSAWMHVPRYGMIAGGLYFLIWVPLLLWNRKLIGYGFSLIINAMLEVLSPDVPFLPPAAAVEPPEGVTAMPDAAVTWFVLAMMALFGLSLAWSLIRSKMLLLPLIVPLPVFMLSLIYTDLPLGHWTVFLLLLYLGACLISGGLRINDAQKYGLATFVVLFSVFLLGAGIRLASPPETYQSLSFETRQEMIGDRMQNWYDDVKSALTNRVKRTENLEDEEEWRRTGDPVMEIENDTDGELYLRAYSLGRYENNAWHAVPDYNGAWSSMAALGTSSSGERHRLSVWAEKSEMLYVPYGFSEAALAKGAESYLAANGTTEYGWNYSDAIPPERHAVTEAEQAYLTWAQQRYTLSAGAFQQAILQYAQNAGLADTGDPYQTALLVADHVRRTGSYTVTPGRIPDGEDFVLYFLNNSRQGYCVHFASATTAILQALDIPARYVFGYRFFVANEGVRQTVTDEMAHAWTEVYVPSVGWVPVESTAGSEGWPEPTEQPSEPEETPEPESTPEPSEAPEDPSLTPEPSELPEEIPSEDPEGEDAPNNPLLGEQPKPAEPEIDPDSENAVRPTDQPQLKKLNLWWLLLLLVPPAIAAALWGIGGYLRSRRQQAFRQKDARSAILAMYRYLLRLERFGAKSDPHAKALAEEAAFSNHPMTEERKTMHAIVRHAAASLQKHPWWKRFAYRWFLFLT